VASDHAKHRRRVFNTDYVNHKYAQKAPAGAFCAYLHPKLIQRFFPLEASASAASILSVVEIAHFFT
jgi:hypothetical protein